jgi:hypothetical protein
LRFPWASIHKPYKACQTPPDRVGMGTYTRQWLGENRHTCFPWQTSSKIDIGHGNRNLVSTIKPKQKRPMLPKSQLLTHVNTPLPWKALISKLYIAQAIVSSHFPPAGIVAPVPIPEIALPKPLVRLLIAPKVPDCFPARKPLA